MPPTENKSKSLSRSQRRRREDIVQASLKIFDRDGFESAKMSDIADEAEVAKGTLYLYFDSKLALLEGVIDDAILPTLRRVDAEAKNEAGSASDRLAGQLKIVAKRMASTEMKILLRTMISGGAKHQRIIDYYHKNVLQNGVALIKKTLEFGVERGEFSESCLDIDPVILVGANVYTSVWKILFEDLSPLESEKVVQDTINVFLKGLETR